MKNRSLVDKARRRMEELEHQYKELFYGRPANPLETDIEKGLWVKRKVTRKITNLRPGEKAQEYEWYNAKTGLRWRGYRTVYEIHKDPKTKKLLGDIAEASREYSRLSAEYRGEQWG